MCPGRRRSDGTVAGLMRHVDGGGAIGRGDAGGDAEAAVGVDADGERGAELLGVVLHHLGQAQLVAALPGQRQADAARARAAS